MCLNARSIINKKNESDIMVDEIKPHIIGITESWANNDIIDAELGLEGYVMFRKDRMGRRGGGVLLYIQRPANPGPRAKVGPRTSFNWPASACFQHKFFC